MRIESLMNRLRMDVTFDKLSSEWSNIKHNAEKGSRCIFFPCNESLDYWSAADSYKFKSRTKLTQKKNCIPIGWEK